MSSCSRGGNLCSDKSNLASYEALKNKSDVVLVMYYQDWCGFCQRIKPKFEEYRETIMHKSVICILVNGDTGKDIFKKEKIGGVPHFKLFKSGKLVGEVVGADEEKLKKLINRANNLQYSVPSEQSGEEYR